MSWRPPQWSQSKGTYFIQTAMVPATSETYVSGSPIITGQGGAGNETTSATYVFDAVLVAQHAQEVVVTKYPVQTGANLAYHSYIMPARVVLEIGMSDAMESFVAGVWTGAATKSASAFHVLSNLKNARQPLLLSTRLFTYNNMVITSLTAEETSKTTASLRATITFEEIFVADGSTTTTGVVSARPQDTQSTTQGTVSGQDVSTTISNQYGVPPCSLASQSANTDYVCTGSNVGVVGTNAYGDKVLSNGNIVVDTTGDTAIGAGEASSVPNSNLPAAEGGS